MRTLLQLIRPPAPAAPPAPPTHLRAFVEEVLALALAQKGLGPLAPLCRSCLNGMSNEELDGFVTFAGKLCRLAEAARAQDHAPALAAGVADGQPAALGERGRGGAAGG